MRLDFRGPATCFAISRGLDTREVIGACRTDEPLIVRAQGSSGGTGGLGGAGGQDPRGASAGDAATQGGSAIEGNSGGRAATGLGGNADWDGDDICRVPEPDLPSCTQSNLIQPSSGATAGAGGTTGASMSGNAGVGGT
jgi:hypothetical protein